MGITQIPHTQALNSGADIWVLISDDSFYWSLKLDWSLNFQMHKKMNHRKRVISEELQTLLINSGLKDKWAKNQISSDSANNSLEKTKAPPPLIIPAETYLPCRWFIRLQNDRISQLKEICSNLKANSVRIFHDSSTTMKNIEMQWNQNPQELDLQIVVN